MARINCHICSKSYASKDSLRKHIKAKHSEYPDTSVNTVDLHIHPTKEKQELNVHRTQRGLPEEKNYLAQYLKERDNYYDSTDFEKYEANMKLRDDERRENPDEAGPSNDGQLLNCHICHLSFSNKEARDDHLDARHPKCQECDDRFVDHAQANKHYTTYHDQQPLIQSSQCPECSQSFSTKQELARHLHSKHRKHRNLPVAKIPKHEAYTCELCRNSFKSAAEILRHNNRKHPHKCNQCPLAFTSKKDLEKHKDHDHSLQIKEKEDSSEDTDEYDKTVSLRNKNEVTTLQSDEDTDEYDRTVSVRNNPRESDEDTDEYDKTVSVRSKKTPDQSLVPRKYDLTHNPRPTLADYHSSDESVESIDEEPLAIGSSQQLEDDSLDDESVQLALGPADVEMSSDEDSPRSPRSAIEPNQQLEDDSLDDESVQLALEPADVEMSSDESVQLALEDSPRSPRLAIEPNHDHLTLALQNSQDVDMPSDESVQLALEPGDVDISSDESVQAGSQELAIKDLSSDEDSPPSPKLAIEPNHLTVALQNSQDVDMTSDESVQLELSSDEDLPRSPTLAIEPRDMEDTSSDESEATVIPKSPHDDTDAVSDSIASSVHESSDDTVKPVPRIDFDESSSSDDSKKHHTEDRPSSDSEISLLSHKNRDSDSGIPSSQLVKCQICHRKFASKHIRAHHIKTVHSSRKYRNSKCVFCEERPENMVTHIKSEHSFACQVCRMRFKTKDLLVQHMTIDHPTCEKCDKSFLAKSELLKHQFKEHNQEESSDEDSVHDSDTESEGPPEDEEHRVTDNRDYLEHINCITVKRFAILRELINKNDFETLTKDKVLLDALGKLMKGVTKGHIPICGGQRLALNKQQKNLIYRLAKNTSGRFVRREKRDLAIVFDVLWKSVRLVSEAFNEYIK